MTGLPILIGGRPKWNREAIDKLLSNEKYTGRVLLQKTVSTGAVQIENNGLMERFWNCRPESLSGDRS